MSQKKLFLTVSMALAAAAHIFKQAGESTEGDALEEPPASPPPPAAAALPKGRPGRKPAAAAAAVVDTSLDDPAAGGVDALDDLGDPASGALDDLDGLGDPAPLKATLKPAVTYTVADVRKKLLELKAKDGDDTTRANKIIRAAVPADLPSSVPNIPAEKYLAVIAQIDKLLKV